MNILDTLTEQRDANLPDSPVYAAYDNVIALMESIENLNALHWKLTRMRDAAEADTQRAPAFRDAYVAALENIHALVLENRLIDE